MKLTLHKRSLRAPDRVVDAVPIGSCPEVPRLKVDVLHQMIDASEKIDLDRFRTHVSQEDFRQMQRQWGYAVGSEKGLHLAKDPCVSYYRSNVDGIPVVYACWSAMEFVFAAPDDAEAVYERMFRDDSHL